MGPARVQPRPIPTVRVRREHRVRSVLRVRPVRLRLRPAPRRHGVGEAAEGRVGEGEDRSPRVQQTVPEEDQEALRQRGLRGLGQVTVVSVRDPRGEDGSELGECPRTVA